MVHKLELESFPCVVEDEMKPKALNTLVLLNRRIFFMKLAAYKITKKAYMVLWEI